MNKMAEFYVSISLAPRTIPNIPNKDIKHIENTPSPSPSIANIGDKDKSHSLDMDELLTVEENEGDIDNPHSNGNTDHVQYPEQTDLEHSRSHNDGYGQMMEIDDEDLLAGMGSGHPSRTPKRQHDRFAYEHDLWGGGNNIYDEAEKVGQSNFSKMPTVSFLINQFTIL